MLVTEAGKGWRGYTEWQRRVDCDMLLWPCVPPSDPGPHQASRTPFCRSCSDVLPQRLPRRPRRPLPGHWPCRTLFRQGICLPRRPQGSPSPGHRAHAAPAPQFVVRDGEKRPKRQRRRREACALEPSVALDHAGPVDECCSLRLAALARAGRARAHSTVQS
jgi:hypothetical protein